MPFILDRFVFAQIMTSTHDDKTIAVEMEKLLHYRFKTQKSRHHLQHSVMEQPSLATAAGDERLNAGIVPMEPPTRFTRRQQKRAPSLKLLNIG